MYQRLRHSCHTDIHNHQSTWRTNYPDCLWMECEQMWLDLIGQWRFTCDYEKSANREIRQQTSW